MTSLVESMNCTGVLESQKKGQKGKVVEAPVVPPRILINTMIVRGLWDQDPSVVKQALSNLADMCSWECQKAEENGKEIARLGGPLAIIKAMERNMDDADIQVEASRAMQNFGLYCDNDIRVLAVQIGGIVAVVEAMNKYRDYSKMQTQGCFSLRYLSHEDEEHQKQVADVGGVMAIIEAMKSHPLDPEVQLSACLTLNKLADGGDYLKNAIVNTSGLSAIGRAAEYHINNSDIRLAASAANKSLWKVVGDSAGPPKTATQQVAELTDESGCCRRGM